MAGSTSTSSRSTIGAFRTFWMASAVSMIATATQRLVVAFYLVVLTNEAKWVGIVTAGMWGARAALLPFAGVLIDRYGAKRILTWTSMLQVLPPLVLVLAFIRGEPSPWTIVAIESVAGALTAFELPGRFTLFPALLPADQVHRASTLGAMTMGLGWLGGPALAALLIKATPYEVAFLINALTFVAVTVITATSSPRTLGKHEPSTVARHLHEGARALLTTPRLRRCVAATTAGALLVTPAAGLIPPMGQLELDGGAWTNTALSTAYGVTSVAVLFLLSRSSHRIDTERVLWWGFATCAPLLVLYAQAPNLLTAVIAMGIWTAAEACSTEGNSMAWVQHHVDPARLGSATALYMTLWNAAFGAGCLGGGVIADHVGIRTALTGGACTFGILLTIGSARTSLRARVRPISNEPSTDRTGAMVRS